MVSSNTISNSHFYHCPVLSRFDLGIFRSPGPGLGNLLFPISRAIVGQNIHGGELIYPTLRQLKIGTHLRRERDTRTYGNILRSRNRIEWKHWALSKARQNVPEFFDSEKHENTQKLTIQYEGLGNYFHDLVAHQAPISKWIHSNANSIGEIAQDYDIGVHIRLGDFVPDTNTSTHHSVRQPLDWYKTAYEVLTNQFNITNPSAFLFTDDNPQEIASKLDIENIAIDPAVNAITSIVNLSKAKYIITSRSTFSMWAVFLGQPVAVWNKSFDLSKSMPIRNEKDIFI